MNKRVIAIVGMSGAGKSEAGAFFTEKGLPVLRFGSVVDDGIKEEGLEWNAENNTYFREKIRKELGMAAIAIKMLPKILAVLETNDIVILDGLYSWEEYIFLKEKLPNLQLLCVYARPSIRYERLNTRKDRPFTYEEAHNRDIHEIEVINKGGPIAVADYVIKNESTQTFLEEELRAYWSQLSEK
jgi:dephospho-CoA kinase